MNAAELDRTVITGGFCIGCGACVGRDSSPFTVMYDRYGRLGSNLIMADNVTVPFTRICPFGETALDEDYLAERFLPDAIHRHAATGRYISCCIGHVSDEDERSRASSGGIGRWLLAELLETGQVDSVVHVVPIVGADDSRGLFEYTVSKQAEQLSNTARSAYFPVSLDQAIEHIRKVSGRYAVIGVPCFIKALRLLALEDAAIRDRVAFTIGIVCGHLKSAAFAESLAWQLGVPPADLGGIEFRGKLEGLPANHKGVSAYSREYREWTTPISSKQLLGGDWGLGLFKYKACDYCDDVLAETADVAIGDAWLPEFVRDSRGSSIVVCRNPIIDDLLAKGASLGRLKLLHSCPDQIARSQAGGLRHRREGLAYRLSMAESLGYWHPPKRVSPDAGIKHRRQFLYAVRSELTDASHEAFLVAKAVGDPSVFQQQMQPLIERYRQAQMSRLKVVRRMAGAWLSRFPGRAKGSES